MQGSALLRLLLAIGSLLLGAAVFLLLLAVRSLLLLVVPVVVMPVMPVPTAAVRAGLELPGFAGRGDGPPPPSTAFPRPPGLREALASGARRPLTTRRTWPAEAERA